MDASNFTLQWNKCYNGGQLMEIDADTYCYLSGKFIIFSNGRLPFQFPGTGISAICVHKNQKLVAIGDKCLDPNIYIYNTPGFQLAHKLKGGAKLEFQFLAFSSCKYLASVSGIPDFKLSLWLYEDSLKLCSVSLPYENINNLSFNPTSWHYLCVTFDTAIHIYKVMRSNDYYELEKKILECPIKNRKLKNVYAEKELLPHFNMEIPVASIAGIYGERAVNLPLKLEDPQRMHVVSHTWGLDCLLIGCFDGEILKISDNYSKLSVLFNPADELTSHDYLTTVDFMGNVQKDWSRNMEHMLYHKKHLYTGGSMGFLSVFEFNSKGHIQWTNMYNEELNISSMILCKDHIMIGTREGRIQLHDPEKINQFTTVTNESSAEFVGFKPIYPGNTYAASARVNGLINIWEIKSGEKISEINLNKKICCLDCNPTTCIVIFGLHDGHIVVVDTQDESSPQIVNTSLICSNPICYLRYDSQSIYFFVLSANKMLFIIDGSIKNRCKVYGFVELPNYLISLTTYNSDGVKVYIPAHTDFVEGSPYFNKLIFLYIDPNFKTDYKSFYMNNMCQIDPEKLRMNILLLTSPASGLVITGSSKLYTTFENTMELVHINYKYDPELMPVGVWEMSNQYSFPNFAVSSMCTSYDKQWVIIATQDGSVHVFLSANMSQVQLSTVVLDYHNYDMKSMSMTWDCDYLLTLCTDGTASCFTINYDVKAATKTQRKLTKEWFRSVMKQPSMTSTESESSDQMEEIITNLQLETESSPLGWLEKKQKLALEEKELEVAEEKQKIRESINVIRNTVCEMLKTNEERPDIEKLEPYEFDLDVEEQARLLAEGEATILKIYQNTEYDNLAKIFIKDKIKEECYDQMFKKGRALKAFLIPLKVDNFPLIERTEEELKLLQRIEYKRKIEKIVDSLNSEILEMVSKNAGPTTDIYPSLDTAQEEAADSKTDDKQASEPIPAIVGSFGASYGGSCPYLYNQLELHSRDQKISQIILLQDVIYKIKVKFNKEFDELFTRKEAEMAKIKTKNLRVSAIVNDLGLDVDVIDPELSIEEKPELAFTIKDSEVPFQKYQTPAELKEIEEEKLREEERRRREKEDNSHERGIMDMMGGVLEIRREDELKKDIPIPAVGPNEEDWTEEEVKIMQEYDRKVKELNEEREKYRKGLESELKKLRGAIQEIMMGFDELLSAFFQKHTQVLMAIYQEELKLSRIKLNLMVEDEFATYEKDLIWKRNCKRMELEKLTHDVKESDKRIGEFRAKYEHLILEDKHMEKTFRNEFINEPVLVMENVYKQYKKRPRAYRFKVPEMMLTGEVPIHVIQHHQKIVTVQMANTGLPTAIEEMDNDSNRPDGMDIKMWLKVCHLRRAKLRKEEQIMQSILVFGEMGDFHQHKVAALEKVHTELDEFELTLKKLKLDKQHFHIDIDIQLLMKQGQVELEHDVIIHDYDDAVLIHRNIIEDLNTKIKELGEQKIASMVESKNFRKQIFQKEWEHRKMMMMMEDLKQKMNIVKFMKVTREVQKYLEEENFNAYNVQQTERLEKLIVGVQNIHERKYQKIDATIEKLKNNIKAKKKENDKISKEIELFNVHVNERRHIARVCQETPAHFEKARYRKICQRKNLVMKVKEQGEELIALRKEVERLRRRTFPALI